LDVLAPSNYGVKHLVSGEWKSKHKKYASNQSERMYQLGTAGRWSRAIRTAERHKLWLDARFGAIPQQGGVTDTRQLPHMGDI
jgi:hypothetical protein